MGAFSEHCNRAGTLSRLRSITLTVDEHTSLADWQRDVLGLLANAPLQQFHISTIGGHVNHRLSDEFCKAVVSAHGERLTRFSVHRMRMGIGAIGDICARCPVLQQLFIVVEQNDLVSHGFAMALRGQLTESVQDTLGSCLAHARRLKAVHINRPLDFGSEDVPRQSYNKILGIARECPPTVKQFGFNTRVFQVRPFVRYINAALNIDRWSGPECLQTMAVFI